MQETDYAWLTEPYPVTLVVDVVFRGFLTSSQGRQATLQYMRRGDSWGLARSISEQPAFEQHLHFQALVPARLLLIRGTRFRAAAERDPAVGLALARELARLMMLRTSALEASVLADTATRIAQHISQLAISGPDSKLPTVWFSQQELADSVGTVREVVSRIIGRFRAQGIVRYADRKLEILDVEALAQVALIE
ncbi:putative Crp/Fnr family transcriptional regulator [Streptomyces hygroscopicus subsp. jinggangensis 5008]|nr:putative Crp/Fnr family transcriptional regulator [Streptomyces hygroscopicus subsp. jinggangensis 5008]